MKKILIAATATLIATLSFASASQAGGKWWPHHGHHGWHGNFGIIIDASPRYVEDDFEDCYVKKIRKYDRHGNLYIKKIQVCD